MSMIISRRIICHKIPFCQTPTFKLMDGKANMSIASYYDLASNHHNDLLPGIGHVQVDLGFSYKNDFDLETPLARMFAPLQPAIWMTIAALICCAAIIILLMKLMNVRLRQFIIGGRVNRTPVFNMICVALGGNIANQRMRYLRYFGTFSRTLTMIWMLSFLILRNAYQCSLYDYLHTQKVVSPYDTFGGIKESNTDILIESNGLDFMSQFFDRKR